MSVEKRQRRDGSIVYVVRWRDSTGKQRSQNVARQRDAIALDGELKRKKALGELVTHERGRETLEDFWTIWWRRYALAHLTPRTRDVYRRLWLKHVEPALGRRQLRDLTPEDVAELISRLVGTLAPSSVRKCIAILQGVLQRAVEWRYISVNPASGVRKPRLVQRRGQALSEEQLTALISELPDLRSRCVVRLLAHTGLRPGELRALRWGAITADGILVDRAVSRNELGPTKTHGVRLVPLSPWARKAIAEWRISQLARGLEDLVFPAVSGRGVWTDAAWNLWSKRVFSKAAQAAGLIGLRPYDLRHTYVTRLISEGRNPIDVARWSGHSLEVCFSTYAHAFERARLGDSGGDIAQHGVLDDAPVGFSDGVAHLPVLTQGA